MKITALNALAATPASGDLVPIVDVSDTSMAASGSTRKIAISDLLSGVLTASGGTMTGLLTIGSGDAVSMYNATTPTRLSLIKGTSAAGDSSPNPLLKVERTLTISSGSFTGDGVEACSAVVGITSGTSTNDGQTVGVAGLAKSASTTVASTGGDDACGVYGVGRITGSGTGFGIGGFFTGRRDTNTGNANALELQAHNNTATTGTYSSTGISATSGIWLNANGAADSGVGLAIGNPFGFQFEVGIGFPAQVAGGKTGGASAYTIRDDGNATTSIAINGTHTTALVVASGAGKFLYGRTSDGGFASDVIIQSTNDNRSGAIVMAKSGTQVVSIFQVASSAGTELFGVGSTGNVRMTADTNFIFSTGTGTKIGTATTQKIGFWNATPVVQPAAYTVTGNSTDRAYTKETYTPTNVSADTAFDANATSVDELADVLGTLCTKFNEFQDFAMTFVADVKTTGLVG